MDNTNAVLADEDLWSDEICALVDAAFETVSRNPNDHEEAVAYRRAIAAALRQPTQTDALREALEAAPIISQWEGPAEFRARQDEWLQGKYKAALEVNNG